MAPIEGIQCGHQGLQKNSRSLINANDHWRCTSVFASKTISQYISIYINISIYIYIYNYIILYTIYIYISISHIQMIKVYIESCTTQRSKTSNVTNAECPAVERPFLCRGGISPEGCLGAMGGWVFGFFMGETHGIYNGKKANNGR